MRTCSNEKSMAQLDKLRVKDASDRVYPSWESELSMNGWRIKYCRRGFAVAVSMVDEHDMSILAFIDADRYVDAHYACPLVLKVSRIKIRKLVRMVVRF